MRQRQRSRLGRRFTFLMAPVVLTACLHYQPCGTFAFHDQHDPSAACNAFGPVAVPLQVEFTFDPAKCKPAAAACQCDKVVYLQMIRISDPTVSKDKDNDPNAYKKSFFVFPDNDYFTRQTKNGWSLDVLSGRVYAYYGMGDDGAPLTVGKRDVLLVPGNNGPTPVVAKLHDKPRLSSTVFGPNVPRGPAHATLFEAVDAPVCIQSRDDRCNNKILGYLYWRIRADAGDPNVCLQEVAPIYGDDDYTDVVLEAIAAWNNTVSKDQMRLPDFKVFR